MDKKNFTRCFVAIQISSLSRFSDIHLSQFFMSMYVKKKVKFHWNINYKHALKTNLFYSNTMLHWGFFFKSKKKKTARKLSISHFFFQKKVLSGLTYDEQNRYLNRRKVVYAFVPCSLHCYSGTRKKILLYRLQFLKRNSSRRIVGDWEISCKQI